MTLMSSNDLISKANTLQIKLNYRDDTDTIVIKMLWNMLVPFFNAFRDLANRKISKLSEFTDAQAAEIKGILRQFSDKPKEQKLVGYMLLREANKKYHFTDEQYDQCEREMGRVADNQYSIGFGLHRH